MAQDRIIRFGDRFPTPEVVGFYLANFLGGVGRVERTDAGPTVQFTVVLPGELRFEFRQERPDLDPFGGDDRGRWIEVYHDSENRLIDVITRRMDGFTEALASGMVRSLARFWGGVLEEGYGSFCPGGSPPVLEVEFMDSFIPHCPGCDRPLVPFTPEHLAGASDADSRRPPGDWTCLDCPGAIDLVRRNRYFWNYQMPPAPGVPDAEILREIKSHVRHVLEHDRRSVLYSAWSTYAILYLLGRLGEGVGEPGS